MGKEKKITIAIPAENVEYVEAVRIYNIKVPLRFFRSIVLKEVNKHIDLLSKHCENKKAQHKCSACIVLGDLAVKIGIK